MLPWKIQLVKKRITFPVYWHVLKSRGKKYKGAELTEDLNINVWYLNNDNNVLVWKGYDTWCYQCWILVLLLLPGKHFLILLLPFFLNPLIVQVQLQKKQNCLKWAWITLGNQQIFKEREKKSRINRCPGVLLEEEHFQENQQEALHTYIHVYVCVCLCVMEGRRVAAVPPVSQEPLTDKRCWWESAGEALGRHVFFLFCTVHFRGNYEQRCRDVWTRSGDERRDCRGSRSSHSSWLRRDWNVLWV